MKTNTNLVIENIIGGTNMVADISTSIVGSMDKMLAELKRDDLEPAKKEKMSYYFQMIAQVRKTPESIAMQIAKMMVDVKFSPSGMADFSALAVKLGQKVSPKYIKLNGKEFRVGMNAKVAIGGTLLQFGSTSGIYGFKLHSISGTPRKNRVVVPKFEFSSNERALIESAIEADVPRPNLEPTQLHGSYCMLNSSGFVNTSLVHGREAYEALDKLQAVPLELNIPHIEKYFSEYRVQKYSDVVDFNNPSTLVSYNVEMKRLSDHIKEFQDEVFYLDKAFDFRGRDYDKTTYITGMGDSFRKSMLSLFNKEVLTSSGEKWLKIAIAGLIWDDKKTFFQRYMWFKSNEDSILAGDFDKDSDGNLNYEAIALIDDYRAHLRGEAVGSIVRFDATNSALQIYSLLGRDEKLAMLCNIVDTDQIMDSYGILAEGINKRLGDAFFDRTHVKKSFMIYLYGAMKKRILFGDRDDIGLYNYAKSFGLEIDADSLYEIFEETLQEIVPSAFTLMNVIYSFMKKGVASYQWTMPDGFKVEFNPHKTLSTSNGTAESMTFMDSYFKEHEVHISYKIADDSGRGRALAPDIIHSIDAYQKRCVVRRFNHDLLTIHDSYGTHPNHVDELLNLYREVNADMLEMDLLENILNQIGTMSIVKLPKGGLTRDDVLSSRFSLA